MDFITGLPEYNGKNALMVCCNKLSKLTRLIQTWVVESQLSVPEVAKLYFSNLANYYGVPQWLVYDHDMHFTALFWDALWAMLQTQTLLNSAYHP